MIQDRISQLPDDVLLNCLSLLDLKNAAQTSILSKRWSYLWTHLTNLDFDPKVLKMEVRKYFACVKQVLKAHRAPTINKFRIETCCNLSNAREVEEWVKFALTKRARELVLDGIDVWLISRDNNAREGFPFAPYLLTQPRC